MQCHLASAIDDALALAFATAPSIPSAILVALPPPAIFKLSLGAEIILKQLHLLNHLIL